MFIHNYLSHQLLIMNLHFFVSFTQPSTNLNIITLPPVHFSHHFITKSFTHSSISQQTSFVIIQSSCFPHHSLVPLSSSHYNLAPTHPSILSASYIPSIISPIPFILQSFHLSHHYQHSTHHMPLLHSFIVPS